MIVVYKSHAAHTVAHKSRLYNLKYVLHTSKYENVKALHYRNTLSEHGSTLLHPIYRLCLKPKCKTRPCYCCHMELPHDVRQLYRKLAPNPRAMQWIETSRKLLASIGSGQKKTTLQGSQWGTDACCHMVSGSVVQDTILKIVSCIFKVQDSILSGILRYFYSILS